MFVLKQLISLMILKAVAVLATVWRFLVEKLALPCKY